MDMYMVDMAVPNEGWSDESKLWFNKLNELTKSGEWKKMKSFVHGKYSKALFTRSVSVGHPGKFFEYAFFCNKEESMLRGVCQFGSRTEGPPSHAHGGAVASIIDAASGVLCHYVSRVPRVTANMNINYRRPTPLCETILTEAHVDKTEGRKSFISCKLTSPDGKTIYAEGTVLFIQIDVSNIPQLNQE
ncbi:acyl-coenzyme A thioesterase THEM4-like [Saccoglossus kowalevskii]|uniref:Acyl-coenzyme A thioesterase THEM4 n=1 Tax=Saccoglossus kowalevskii TaxID=10224 RepID=A0ABM0MHN7_SACKO|nr:PREDICTED: acyl-coenzyme A thioesterase THEM4-like [Saccoglossus kowalevskii]